MLFTVLHYSIMALIFAIGMTANGADIIYLWQRPVLLIKSIVTMYLVVPAIAIIMTLLLKLPAATELALVILAICAGAPLLPKKLIQLGGNPAYVFSLIVTTSLLAIVTVPLSLDILADFIPFNTTAATPMGVASVILKSFLWPLAAGMLARWLLPALADAVSDGLLKVAGVAMAVCALIVLIMGFRSLLEVGLDTLLAFALFTLAAMVAGHMQGGPERANRTALAIACSSRHIGLALLIASNAQRPETLTLVIAYLFASALVSALYIAWIRHRRPRPIPA
jgi:predicted Na+-dependent transporter